MSDAVVPLEIDVLGVRALQESGESFFFLDCRTPGEYETAKIEGTTLIPMGEIAERVGELEAQRDQRIVVHCHHGGRSLRVTNWLRGQGFTKAQNMAGGIDDWALQIDPAVPRY